MGNSLKSKEKISIFIGIIIAALFIIVSILFRTVFFGSLDGLNVWISLLSIIGLIDTIAIAIAEFRKSKEISRATFIVELNQTFIENEQYKRVYDALQNCLDNKCRHINSGCICDKECMLDIDKSIISNYLTFFETLYILIQRGVVSYDIVDDLFAYRFFLVVHSKLVQQKKLIPQPENFRNIFNLEKEWIQYRIMVGKTKEEEYNKAKKYYKKILNNEAIDANKWPNIYCMRPLEALDETIKKNKNAHKYSKCVNTRR